MEVFLVPAGGSRHQLYCEVGDETHAHEQTGAGGWRQRLADRFSSIVATVEAARHAAASRRAARAPRSMAHRLRDRVICWLAEKIAEQRLLWHLRRQDRVTAHFPADMSEADASAIVTTALRADARRHGWWTTVDGLGLVLSLLLIPVPGPNIPGYYFTFRVVGHYLSRLGAQHGLNHVTWRMQPSQPLADLRLAYGLPDDARDRHVSAIASTLRLQHLAAFLDRIGAR